ncbi:alpha-glucosidase, partial [Streptococcus thermophilus]|nr:alpha-glucosidase [Streptococcus thermophilus]
QGQEFGMSNFPFTDSKQLRSDEIIKQYDQLLTKLSEKKALEEVSKNSREHSRTPLQWNDSENAGFTTGHPWMEINPNFSEINRQTNQELIELYKNL